MDVPVELLTDDALSAEDDKTGFLNVGVDCFGKLYLQRRPISLTMTYISTKNKNKINEDK